MWNNNTSPVSPMPLSQHFSDYGFDHQIDYFQVLEEARKHTKETSSIDSTHQFKLQKPISKDDLIRTALHNNSNKKKQRWFLKNALLFFNWRKWRSRGRHYAGDMEMELDVHMARARNFRASSSVGPGSISGPVYVTESWSGTSTPYRTMRPSSLTTSPAAAIPYMSLRELNMERQQRSNASSSSSSSKSGPLYLVT